MAQTDKDKKEKKDKKPETPRPVGTWRHSKKANVEHR